MPKRKETTKNQEQRKNITESSTSSPRGGEWPKPPIKIKKDK